MPVLLVRHANALSRSEWSGDDRERELSDRGRKQSRKLVPVLVEYKPVRILSSPYVRCVETVAPLGRAMGLPVERTDDLAEGSDRAMGLLRSLAGDNVVLCSHGDVIPEILDTLAREDGLDLGPRPRQEKASVWVLEARKGRFTRATYVRPPA